MQRCYLSGPITGTNNYEERFEAAAHDVIKMGMVPVNPVTLLHNHSRTWQAYMKESLSAMLDCEAVYMLRDWRRSEGARIEYQLAKNLEYRIIEQ